MERVRSVVRPRESTHNDYDGMSHSDLRRELYKRNIYPGADKRKCIERLRRHDAGATDLPPAVQNVELFADVEILSTGSVQYRNVDLPFYGVPFDVITKHLLPYLDVMDLTAFAQLSKQFYRRVMAVAIARFKVQFTAEISQIVKRCKGDRYQPYTDKQIEMFERSMDGITPMAIAYFHQIPLVKWNLTVKFVRRHGKNSELARKSGRKYYRELLKMCQRIDKFGSVDAYKKHVQTNSVEVDRELRVTNARMTQNIAVLDNLLRPHGYKCVLAVKVSQTGGFMHSYFVPAPFDFVSRMPINDRTESVKNVAKRLIDVMQYEDVATSGLVIDAQVLNFLVMWGAIQKRPLIFKIKL